LRDAQIWYNRSLDQRVLSEEFGKVAVLGDEFYQETIAHPVTAHLEAVKLLGRFRAMLEQWLRHPDDVAGMSGANQLQSPEFSP
jgi:hypothetical protein